MSICVEASSLSLFRIEEMSASSLVKMTALKYSKGLIEERGEIGYRLGFWGECIYIRTWLTSKWAEAEKLVPMYSSRSRGDTGDGLFPPEPGMADPGRVVDCAVGRLQGLGGAC